MIEGNVRRPDAVLVYNYSLKQDCKRFSLKITSKSYCKGLKYFKFTWKKNRAKHLILMILELVVSPFAYPDYIVLMHPQNTGKQYH